MDDNLTSAPDDDGPPRRIGRWKGVMDALLGNRTIFQRRTERTASLHNIQDDHKQRVILGSDANQAPNVSRIPNHAQDASGCASRTAQIAATQSGTQRPRWEGPGGKKMTPRELVSYERTQRHLQQPFQPIDLFREMWGDNHAEPAFWSGVRRESHIKYYAEHNANTGRKISQHASTCNLPGRLHKMNEEEEPDVGKRMDVGPPSPQKTPGFQKEPTTDLSGHDKSHYSLKDRERTHTTDIYRGLVAMNAYSPHAQKDRLFGHKAPWSPFVVDANENFLTTNLAQRRATQHSERAFSKIRNYRGISFKSSIPGRVPNDHLDEFKNLPRLPKSEQVINSWSATGDFLDEFEDPTRFPVGKQQCVQQQQSCKKLTPIGVLTQQIQLGNKLAEQQLSPQQQRREEETVIDDIILEIPFAHQLTKEKRKEDQHHTEQHYSLLRSASEGPVIALGRANPGRKMSIATTVDSDGGKHRHSISRELLRTTSIPAYGKHRITTETRVLELQLHGLPIPNFTPASNITKSQQSGARDATSGDIVSNDVGGIPSFPRCSSFHGQAGGLLAPDNRDLEEIIPRSPFIHGDTSRAVFSAHEEDAQALSMSMYRPSVAHSSMQAQSSSFQPQLQCNKASYCQPSGRYEDGAVLLQRLVSSPHEYQLDPSTIDSLSLQGAGKKYLRSKRSGNRLHFIEDMGTRSPRFPAIARQVRHVGSENAFSTERPTQPVFQRLVDPHRSSGTPPTTRSLKDAVKEYDPPSTPSKSFLGDTQAAGHIRGKSLVKSKRRQRSDKFKGPPLPFDPYNDDSVEEFMIESITTEAERKQLTKQPIHSLRSVGSTMFEKDALNFFVEDQSPLDKNPFSYENIERSSSNEVNDKLKLNSLFSMRVIPDDDALEPSIDGSMRCNQDQIQFTFAHSTMASMGDQIIRPVDSFVSTGRPFEDAPTTSSETSRIAVDDDEIWSTLLAKNCLSRPLSQSLFPGEIEEKDSTEVPSIKNEVGKRRSEPFVPKTKPVVVKMTRTSRPVTIASGMLCAISTSARLEVEDHLTDFALRLTVNQENTNKETSQQLEERKSASRGMMRACFGFDGAGDEKPERERGNVGSEKFIRKHDYSGSSLLDGRLDWPTGDFDKTSGFNVSPFADGIARPLSSTVTQAREPNELPKQEKLDESLVEACKAVSEELPETGTRTGGLSLKETGSSSNPFLQKLGNNSSIFQRSSRRPSSPAKKAEDLLNRYNANLVSGSQLPHERAETPHLAPMNSQWTLFKVKAKKGFPALSAVRRKPWPPQPTVEDEEEPLQSILPEETLLSKHVMIEIAQPESSLRIDEEPIIPTEVYRTCSATKQLNPSLRTGKESIIPDEDRKVFPATEHAYASLHTEEPTTPKEERKVSFAISSDSVGHQSTEVARNEKLTTTKVISKVSFAPGNAGPAPYTGEKTTILKPGRKISGSIKYGLVNDKMSMGSKAPNSDTQSTTEWSLKESKSNQRKVEERARVGKEVPLNVIPRLYRKTDVAAHGPGYIEICKGRSTDKGDFEGYMAVLPSYLQDPDFALISMPPESRKEEKVVPPASRGDAVRCMPDLLTHVGGTFRHLFDGESSMTTNPANIPLPKSPEPDGGSLSWDDEEANNCYKLEGLNANCKYEQVDRFDVFEEGRVKLFEEEPLDTTHSVSVLLPESPDASRFIWDDEEVDRSDNLDGLELSNVPPDSEPKMGMKLKRHFSSSWRPFPHKVVEPNFVSIPRHIRFRIYQIMLPFSHRHPVLLSPVATTLKFWPERSFRSPSDIFDRIGAMTLVNRQFHDELMAFYLSQMRFHITLNCYVAGRLVHKMWQWLPLFANQMQYLTVEIDFTKGSGNYKDGCALRLDGVAELEKLLRRVIVPLSKRDTPMRGLTIMARRYEGIRPSGQLVPYKTTTSPYEGHEIIRGKGLGKVEQPDEEVWSMIDALVALPGFGEEDEELFYSLPNQKGNKESRWKNWFNLISAPTKAANSRNKMGKSAVAHRFVQNRRPSGFKVTALRLLTKKSLMPDLNDALFVKPSPASSPMSPQPPSQPRRQNGYDHFSQSSSHDSRIFPGSGVPRTSETPQMSPYLVHSTSLDQRVFIPTPEAFRDPLPLFDGNRGSAMMGNWSTRAETATGASVADIEAREKALEAHNEYGYYEEQDKRQKRIAHIKKMSYDRAVARRLKHEPRRWFLSKKAAQKKRVAVQQAKRSSLRKSSRHGRHKKALRRRHEKINMARTDKSHRRRTMPKYKYRVYHAMEQLHRGSIPSKVTVFTRKGFFRTRTRERHVAFLRRRLQTPRAGMLMSSPYLPHDPVDKTLETLIGCFRPPNGPGFLFLRLSGFTQERSAEICLQLVCKATSIQLEGHGRQLWPKEAVGAFGKRRAGARFARFEVFEEANSIPERRGRIIKVEDNAEEKKQYNDRNKNLTHEQQQSEDMKKDLAEKIQLDEEKELAEVLGPVVDAQAKRAEGFDSQRATMKRIMKAEHKHALQEFEFKTVHSMRKKRKSKAMESMETADLMKGTTHVSRFLKNQFKKARSQVGGRRKWRASGMEDDDYDDYRAFR